MQKRIWSDCNKELGQRGSVTEVKVNFVCRRENPQKNKRY